MRKKSHISLARYMVENLNDEGLRKHKFSFYVGSILPDIKPSFIYKRHEIGGTFPSIRRHIERLSEGEKAMEKNGRKYYMDLGQISHYLADYFTFPHNEIYPGSLKDHCSYEEKLKRDLRAYLKGDMELPKFPDIKAALERFTENREHVREPFGNSEALCDFIQKVHDDYLENRHNVEHDIQHIVEVNHMALHGMMQLLEERREEWRIRHS